MIRHCRFDRFVHDVSALTVRIVFESIRKHYGNRIRSINRRLFRFSSGNPIGYHCLRFQPRSNAVIEFKTSNIILKNDDATMCTAAGIFEQSSWTTVAIQSTSSTDDSSSNAVDTVDCVHRGHYSMPKVMMTSSGDGNCYNLSVDCKRSYSMRLVAYHCHSGAIFDCTFDLEYHQICSFIV